MEKEAVGWNKIPRAARECVGGARGISCDDDLEIGCFGSV